MKEILVTRSSMPTFKEYSEMIKPLWESHWLTNMGDYHKELEQKLKEYMQVPELSLMVNGHMALELAIQSMGFPEGSEVITTPFTFISTTHAIIRNHLNPVFCDIKLDDFTIDENKIEELITEHTVAIVAVHVYGNICAVEKIQEIAYKYNLKVIYDAAHAFGEKYKGVGVGNYGDISAFSFHATKVFHTIEGGAVATHSQEAYEKMYNLKNFGIRSEEMVVSVGANAKMNEFSAAMGICNLRHIEDEIKKRKSRVELYRNLLKMESNLQILDENKKIERTYGYFPLLVKDEYKKTRDEICDELLEENIYARKYFYPITSDQVCFKNKYKEAKVKNARYCADRIITLPIYAELEDADIKRICEIVLR